MYLPYFGTSQALQSYDVTNNVSVARWKKCNKDFFLTHTTTNSFLLFAFLFSLMRESLKCNLKCISHLCLLCRHDKIKIALVEYVEQINAHNINIYVWISVHTYTVSYISETSINLTLSRKLISWGNKKNFPFPTKYKEIARVDDVNKFYE